MSKIIGYIRVSSYEQNTDRQLQDIKTDKLFVDKVSGKDLSRPQLEALLSYIRDGDTLIIHSIDRIARNLDDLRHLVKTLTAKDVKIQFVKENLIFTGDDSPMSNLLLSVMGAFAEFERALIRERQMEGIQLAKKRGAFKGRKKALNADQVEDIRRQLADKESKAQIARNFKVSRHTLYKYLNKSSS